MTAVLTAPAPANPPDPYRWTRAKYEEAIRLGLFGPHDPVELVEGEIIRKMTQNSPHATGVTLAHEAVRPAFPSGHVFRIQMPLITGDVSLPEPDIAVVTGSPRDYFPGHPSAERAALIIEISDSTLAFDQTRKARDYARAGIADYWIVNLVERVIEVHRQPTPDGYAQITRHAPGETLSPLAAPVAVIAVADLLP